MSQEDKGIKISNWATSANAPYPAEGAGNQTFSNYQLLGVLFGGPFLLLFWLNWSWWVYPLLVLLVGFPSFAAFFIFNSKYASPWRNKVTLPGRKIEEYITIKDPELANYRGRNKIPMETFFENYFDDKIDLNGDALEILEARHDWVAFEFGIGQLKFFLTQWIPETIRHTKKKG